MNISSKLATIWFYISAAVLLGLVAYATFAFHPSFIIAIFIRPPYTWSLVLLFTAYLLGKRNKDGWWLGMILGGYFVISGVFGISTPLLHIFTGNLSPRTDMTSVFRLIFGMVPLLLLSRKSVMEEFNIELGTTSNRNLVYIASAGFSQALFSIYLLLLGGYLSHLMSSSLYRGVLGIFKFSTVPEMIALAFFPIGANLLRGKQWAYNAALTLWSIIFVWGAVSVVEMIINISRFWAAPIFMSPRGSLGLIFGGLFAWWLLQKKTLEFFNFESETRPQKVRLSVVTVVIFGLIISLSKIFSIPVLQAVFTI